MGLALVAGKAIAASVVGAGVVQADTPCSFPLRIPEPLVVYQLRQEVLGHGAGTPEEDFNGDGVLEVGDILRFLNGEPEPGHLYGWVVDEAGAIPPGTFIDGYDPANPLKWVGFLIVDEFGRFDVLTPGRVEVIIHAECVTYGREGATAYCSAVQQRVYTARTDDPPLSIVIDRSAGVEVHVVDVFGNSTPFENVNIRVGSDWTDSAARRYETHSFGCIDVIGNRDTTRTLARYLSPGMGSVTVRGPFGVGQLRDICVKSDRLTDAGELRLLAGGEIAGRVVDRATSQPVEGASVNLLAPEGAPWDHYYNVCRQGTNTDASGGFLCFWLLPGEVRLEIHGANRVRTIVPGFVVENEKRLEVGDIGALEGAIVEGTVYRSDGTPAVYSDVWCETESTRSDLEGKFRLEGIPPGHRTVEAEQGRYLPPRIASAEVDVVSGVTYQVDLHLPSP